MSDKKRMGNQDPTISKYCEFEHESSLYREALCLYEKNWAQGA